MSGFAPAIQIVLTHEGGYVNDSGGPTNYGISQRWLEQQFGRKFGADEIRDMSLESAVALYREHWWLPVYEKIDRQIIATKIFDMAVNMGHKQANTLVQRACNDLQEGLQEDGILGPMTLKQINYPDPGNCLLDALIAHQLHFYHCLVKQNPSNLQYLKTWERRAKWPL